MRLPRKRTVLLLVVVLLALGAWTAVPYVRAASLVVRTGRAARALARPPGRVPDRTGDDARSDDPRATRRDAGARLRAGAAARAHRAADRRRPRQGDRRAAAGEAGGRSRGGRHAGGHRRDRRPAALPHQPEAHRRPRGRDRLGEPRAVAGRRRPHRRLRRELRRRAVDRRRRPTSGGAARRLRDLVRRAFEPARRGDVPVHRPAARRDASRSARLRRRRDADEHRGADGARRPGGRVARGDHVVHDRVAPGDGRSEGRRRGVLADQGDDGGAARAVAHVDDLREHAERQGAGRGAPAARRRRSPRIRHCRRRARPP